MKKISMLDFRLDAERIIARVQKGERLILTRRGKPVAQLVPIAERTVSADDPFYSLCDFAEPGESLSNEEIDDIVYGE